MRWCRHVNCSPVRVDGSVPSRGETCVSPKCPAALPAVVLRHPHKPDTRFTLSVRRQSAIECNGAIDVHYDGSALPTAYGSVIRFRRTKGPSQVRPRVRSRGSRPSRLPSRGTPQRRRRRAQSIEAGRTRAKHSASRQVRMPRRRTVSVLRQARHVGSADWGKCCTRLPRHCRSPTPRRNDVSGRRREYPRR